jgi:ferredoxin
MAQALHAGGDAFEMHYFVRGPEHTPFTDRLKALEPGLKIHGGLDAAQTSAKLNEIFAASDPATVEVYTCGPGPMIDAVTRVAALRGIPEEHIRFEYFKNDEVVLTGAEFQVSLTKSGKTFTVPADKTLLKACLDNGVEIEASCEQGVCGTCLTGVVSGEPEHNDTYLSKKERESGKFIMPCVSRCKSSTLVLDL